MESAKSRCMAAKAFLVSRKMTISSQKKIPGKRSISDQKIEQQKPKLLFVGAFPPPNRKIYGGNVTACRVLMQSSFPVQLNLDLIDSTQISNPAPSFPIRLMFAIRRFLYFVYRFEICKPDFVLLFTGSGAGLLEKGLMARYSKYRNRKAFIFPRGGGILKKYSEKKDLPLWVTFSFKPAEKIFCQGILMQNLARKVLQRPTSQTVVIPNWTASPSLLSIGEEKKYSTDNNKIVKLIFVGWLEKEKGIFELLETINNIKTKYRLQLYIAGDGTARKEVEHFVKKNNLSAIVTLLGWIDEEMLLEKYKEADVFVLPSWKEGLPNVLIEAMATGLCVIVSNVGNIPDVIQSGKNGFLIPPMDVKNLNITLSEVLDNSLIRREMGKNAHTFAKTHFGVEQSVEKMIKAMLS